MGKRILALLLTMILVSSLFAACGEKEASTDNGETKTEKKADTTKEETKKEDTKKEDATEASAEAQEPVTIVVTTWDSTSQLTDDMVAGFQAEYPHITVEFQSIVQGYDEKLQIMNASGETPDVLLMWNTPQYVESGIVEPLDAYIARDNYDMDQYYPVTADWAKYKGQTWGLPKDVTPRAMFYNKGVFDGAGVAYPEDGWTWADFTETVKSLTNGKTGDEAQYGFIALAGQTYMLQHFIWSNGGQLTSDDGMSATGFVNSAENVETLAWFKDVFDSSAKSLVSTGDGNPGNAEFMSGKIAMMDNGSWPIADLRNEPGLEFGIVTPPVPEAGMPFKPVVHSATWSMFAESQNKEAAWEFIKWVGGPAGAELIGASGFSTTAIPAVNDELGLKDTELGKFLEILELPTNSPEFTKNPRYFESDGAFGTAVAKILLDDADILESLTEAATEMDSILSNN